MSGKRPLLDKHAQRAIIVPFPTATTMELEVSTIGTSHVLNRTFDKNSIFVEFVPGTRGRISLVRLRFYDEDVPLFAVLKADSAEMEKAVLITTAWPA
ncbi:hypothetical protein G5V57_30970 [Nordella sp. HKS 07]|uniref:hypothetical protein n=1 Tax=Nordella sp. HKS 07 TaxID=2712222 RepID=UPI0013E1C39B|nr:hypothetical protein [Nordella sp. HKS 07]QIG51747.1 hypothetical protein G5V57_30970 [Nordella sp. HKS 07]